MKLSAVKQKGHSYNFAWDRLQNDKAIFIEDVQKGPLVMKDTLHTHKRDSKDDAYQTWLSKVIDNSGELKHAPADLQDNKRFILKAVRKNPFVLEFAPYHLQNDKEIVMEAISVDCWAIKYAAAPIRDDEEFMLMVIEKDGVLLQFASERIRNDKRTVLQAVKRRGTALKYAGDDLRKDKDVVMAAAFSNSDSFKYALGDVKQDKDCLTAAGIWDEDYSDEISHQQLMSTKKIALSTRFSLMPESEYEATNFTKFFKSHPLIKGCNFSVYSPNAFEKSTCDPTGDYTDFNWICRGTKDTCQKEDSLKTSRPTNACCWRYSYRCQLENARNTDGFMLQIMEAEGSRGLPQELGNGQKIETDMAQKIGTKIFRGHLDTI